MTPEEVVREFIALFQHYNDDPSDYPWSDVVAAAAAAGPALDALIALVREYEARVAEAERVIAGFYRHAGSVDRRDGFSAIESPEPWRAAGRYFDRYHGGTTQALASISDTEGGATRDELTGPVVCYACRGVEGAAHVHGDTEGGSE